MSANTNKSGFTLVEMIVVITAGSIIGLVFIGFAIGFLLDTMKSRAETDMIIESQQILRQVADDMRYSSGILSISNLSDPHEPAAGWKTSNDDLILILQSPAQRSGDREFIIDPDTGKPYSNEIIYFTDNGVLYKRVLANPLATGNRAFTTCPEAEASAACPQDPILSENFKDMNFVFYDQNGDVTTQPDLGRSVSIIIDLEKNAFGELLEFNNSIRMTLRNPYL